MMTPACFAWVIIQPSDASPPFGSSLDATGFRRDFVREAISLSADPHGRHQRSHLAAHRDSYRESVETRFRRARDRETARVAALCESVAPRNDRLALLQDAGGRRRRSTTSAKATTRLTPCPLAETPSSRGRFGVVVVVVFVVVVVVVEVCRAVSLSWSAWWSSSGGVVVKVVVVVGGAMAVSKRA